MNRMNLVELQRKLTAAARLQPPDDRVPYAFEKRILARLAERTAASARVLWARWFWRAAVSCVAVALACGAISFFTPAPTDNTNNDLSQEFENTLLASVDQADNAP